MFTILYSCFPVFNCWEFGGGRGDGLMVMMWWWNCDNGGWREIRKGLIRHDKTLVRFGGPCAFLFMCAFLVFSFDGSWSWKIWPSFAQDSSGTVDWSLLVSRLFEASPQRPLKANQYGWLGLMMQYSICIHMTHLIYIYFSFGPRSTTSTEYFSMCFCCLVKRTQTNPWPDPHNDGRTRLFFLQELPNLVPNSCDLLLNIGCPNIWLLIISHFFPTSLFWNMNRGARPKFNIEPTNWVLNFWSWFSCYPWRFLGYHIRFWSCGSIPPCLMQPDACWRSKVAFASITLHVVLAMPVPFHACAEPKQQKVRFAPWSGKKLWMHGSQSQCMFMGHMDRLPNNMIWCFGVSKRLTTMGHAPKWQLRRENNDEPKVFWIYLQANPGGIAKWIVPYI